MAYTIQPARYAKGRHGAGMCCIICTPNGSGYKTRAMRLAEARGVGGRFSHREGGYIVSQTAAGTFRKLYNAGWDADSINQVPYNPSAQG
jgi:hypothetical protein